MSDINNLVNKILAEREREAERIIAEAEEKAAGVVAESVESAEKEKTRILEAAELDAAKQAEQLVSGKKLEIRDEHLDAKRQVIERVFEAVREKLNNMPKEKFLGFVKNHLTALDLDGWELVLPKKYGIADIAEVNSLLDGKNAGLKLHTGGRDVTGGFVMLKAGVENNNTFDALVDYYRYELESEITAKLF